jgi:hypothetical protein
MTVKELKEALNDFKDDRIVYVDFDREGGNEDEAIEVKLFYPQWLSGSGKPPGVRIGC